MMEWEQLIKRAIVGTQQQPGDLPTTGIVSLQALMNQYKDFSEEKKLLTAIAITGRYRRAGISPWHQIDIAEETVDAAQEEQKPYCVSAVSTIVTRIISNQDIQLAAELLALLAQAGQLVPAEFLPGLMTMASKNPHIAPLLTRTMGYRGQWLCHKNPDWANSLATTDGLNWHEYTGERRLQLFCDARATDSAQALHQLQDTWNQLVAKQRQSLLEILGQSLSLNDLEFLRSLEKDRSQQIRAIACQYRLKLGDESLHQWVIDILNSMLSMQRSRLSFSTNLLVELPAEYDKQWKLLGIAESLNYLPDGGKTGAKSGWLFQLLSIINPSKLAHSLDYPIKDLLKAIQANQFSTAMLQALDISANTVADESYLECRYNQIKQKDRLNWLLQNTTHYAAHITHSRLLDGLAIFAKKPHPQWLNSLKALDHYQTAESQFSVELSAVVVDILILQTRDAGELYQNIKTFITGLAYRLDLSCFDMLNTRLQSGINEQLEPFRLCYQQRYELTRELKP